MSAQAPVALDHPLMKAWEDFKKTEGFESSRRWGEVITIDPSKPVAIGHPHLEGTLWNCFCRGWMAAGGDDPSRHK